MYITSISLRIYSFKMKMCLSSFLYVISYSQFVSLCRFICWCDSVHFNFILGQCCPPFLTIRKISVPDKHVRWLKLAECTIFFPYSSCPLFVYWTIEKASISYITLWILFWLGLCELCTWVHIQLYHILWNFQFTFNEVMRSRHILLGATTMDASRFSTRFSQEKHVIEA